MLGPRESKLMVAGFKVLFVEDDPAVRESVGQTLEMSGFEVMGYESAEEAVRFVRPGFRGIVITDVRLPCMDGLSFMRRVLTIDADIPVILVTGHGDIALAVRAMREGAYDFIEKPFSPQRLTEAATRAIEKRALHIEVTCLRQRLTDRGGAASMLLGNSVAMQEVRRQILTVAPTSADVLIVGETGTGKELVARSIHADSPRSRANFVAINCGGIPETLFESEVFGHEAGAFTGAGKRRVGRIEYAEGGTLFLDEIESMPLTFQVKVLRTLQERKVERLGSNASVGVDFRVVAATKYDLMELSNQGKFRSDLYYRLGVVIIELPPLRERPEDIALLFEHFVAQAAARFGRDVPDVSQSHLRQLVLASWPGNVRELKNAADRFVLGMARPKERGLLDADLDHLTLPQQMELLEKALIEQALRAHAGHSQQVREALGIAKKTFYDKIHRHGINLHGFRDHANDNANDSADSEKEDAP